MTIVQEAQLIREAMDAAGLVLTEEQAMECVWLYKPWAAGMEYVKDMYITYGTNGVGDPQLYRVVQSHTSQEEWTPDTVPALYTPIGLDDKGYPVWSQPTGAHDAYNIGDIVDYEGTLYRSTIDGNIWSPESYPAGWEIYAGRQAEVNAAGYPMEFEEGAEVMQGYRYTRDNVVKVWTGRQKAKPEWDDPNWEVVSDGTED